MDEKLQGLVSYDAPFYSVQQQSKQVVHDLMTRSRLLFYSRVEKVKDLVLYRYGSTGVQNVLEHAITLVGVIPVFPVRNINNFSSGTWVLLLFSCASTSSPALRFPTRSLDELDP